MGHGRRTVSIHGGVSGFLPQRPTRAAARVAAALVAVVSLLVVAVASPAASQVVDPGVGVGIVPRFPGPVFVGQSYQANIEITNLSRLVGPVTLTEITLDPACGDTTPSCDDPDLGVFALAATGTCLQAGPGCTGQTVTISGPDANGRYVFTPVGAPIVLQPTDTLGSSVTITFGFTVLKMATADVAPDPGVQIGQFATVAGFGFTTTVPSVRRVGSGTGTGFTTVLRAAPTINTVATPAVLLTESISDVATVTGPAIAPTPTGDVTFTLFGPDDGTCAGVPVFTSTTDLIPGAVGPPNDATANSGPFTPTQPGDYRWVAVYSGDANFDPVTSPCGAPNELSTVSRPVAAIDTVATSADIGGTIRDVANVTTVTPNAPPPTGTVTFTLFQGSCAGPLVFTSPNRPIVGGVATSGDFLPPTATSYFWVATYNGDDVPDRFLPVTSPCGAQNEQSDVIAAMTDITTEATPAAPVGTPISDTAVLSGGVAPTGFITFDLYGPDDELCTGQPIFSSEVPVSGNGSYVSGPFTPTVPGTYFWIASYDGDAANTPATGVCGEEGEITEVFGPPTIQVVKTADPTTLPEPGGTFTFNVVVTNTGPNDLVITSLTDSIEGGLPIDLSGLGTCTNAVGTPLAADPDGAGPALGGTYSCSFDREFTGIGGASQNDVVTVVGIDEFDQTANDDDDAIVSIINDVPDILVEKSVTPESMPEPGGLFAYTVVVTNTGAETLVITSLTDDVYGDLATKGTCTTAVDTELDTGESYTCTFDGEFLGSAGDTETDTVTVIGEDDEGTEVDDDDDATVLLTDVLPTVQVVKSATPLTMGEPGGTFTFNVVVTNTSPEPVTITELTDDVYGDLATKGTCTDAVDTLLPVGDTYACSFTGDFIGDAGDAQTDIVTVVVVDDDDNTATDDDDAVVTLTDVLPTVSLDKVAVPTSLVAPGGNFTFNVKVTNTSLEPVTIKTLTDDVYGNIATQGTCANAIGIVLQPGETYACSFTGEFKGNAGQTQTDIVTVTVTDDEDNTATDTDDAVVRLTPVPVRVTDQNIITRPRPIVRGTLARTGSAAAGLSTLAGALVLTGSLLLLASRLTPTASPAGAAGHGTARATRRQR